MNTKKHVASGYTGKTSLDELIDSLREENAALKEKAAHLEKCVEAERKIKHIGEQHQANYMAENAALKAEVERLKDESVPTSNHKALWSLHDAWKARAEKAEAELDAARPLLLVVANIEIATDAGGDDCPMIQSKDVSPLLRAILAYRAMMEGKETP